MAKSAQQKFSEYLDECQLTRDQLKALSSASFEYYGNYSHTAGFFESMLAEVINQLPRARREEIRQRLEDASQRLLKEHLMKKLKEPA